MTTPTVENKGTETTPERQTLLDYIHSLCLDYTATFQPTPQATEKYPKLHWLVTLSRKKQSIQIPYSEGIAHIQGYRQTFKTSYDQQVAEQLYRKTCETGKLFRRSDTFGDLVKGVQPPPNLPDVLYCLVMDASVLNYSHYEAWASDFGYDPDSRAGETIYRACLKESLALKQLIGYEALEQLTKLYEGY